MTEETQTTDPKQVVKDLMEEKKAVAENLKAAKAEVREAKKNVTAAEKYRKSLADDADEIPAADEALAGWQTAVTDREKVLADIEAQVEANKTALAEAREAAKGVKAGEPKPKAERVEQNGVKQPKEGTKTRRVWDIADEVSASRGDTAAFEEVWAQTESEGLVKPTTQTQYAAWRRFHGITGRVKSAAQIEAAAKVAQTTAPAPAPAAE